MFSELVSRRFLAALGASAALVTAGCADTRGGSIPYDRPLAAPDQQSFQVLPEDYKIAPMDTLTIKVFKADDLSGDYSVDLAGHISLPLVGQVEAANLTTSQLDDKLKGLLGQKYFQHPDVSVAIKESTAHVVTVDGAVTQSGQFPVAGSITLVQAVALAHGTTPDANARRVAVFRTIDGQRMAAAFDLTSIRRGEAKDPAIYPGDIVVVDGSKIKEAEKQIFAAVPLLYAFRAIP
ncbi:MAG TPA: polysaccharide biosynthesis/export family protein [Sphingomicrobium sp.]